MAKHKVGGVPARRLSSLKKSNFTYITTQQPQRTPNGSEGEKRNVYRGYPSKNSLVLPKQEERVQVKEKRDIKRVADAQSRAVGQGQ